jgi:murein L,D-transpeptidase YafK
MRKWIFFGLIACVGLAAAYAAPLRQALIPAYHIAMEKLFPRDDRIAWEDSLAKMLHGIGWKEGSQVFIRIFKDEHALELYGRHEGQWRLLKTYEICRYSGKLGPKHAEGDRQAPEGFYMVGKNQLNPFSRHHLSFNLGFPNEVERAQGKTGSFLMVHGGCSSIGCYAITDPAVEEVYRIVEAALDGGQQAVAVHAFPFRMTAMRLAENQSHPAFRFWEGLKPGYDAFETEKALPVIYACNDKYSLATGEADTPGGCAPLRPW